MPPRLTRAQIFVWTVEKYGRVNADILYYRKIANLVHARWGMGCVPSHGKTLGDERDLATIIKNRFENGRRSNAQFVYRNVPVSRINLCADGQQLVQQVRLSPGLAARGASLFLVRACSSANAPAPFLRRLLTTACPFATPQGLHVHVDQPDVDIADDSATPPEQLQGAQEDARLTYCLACIAEEPRQALVLAYYEGLTHVEVAERLTRPLGTVKAWVRRSLLSLQECLQGGSGHGAGVAA